jgi:DNA-binding MarR family transcriptional regulator
MDEELPWYETLVLPVLLAAARKTYGKAISTSLSEAGFTDMPRLGSRVLGGIRRNGPSLNDLARALDVSKQGASQVVDTLVVRGYVVRLPHPTDRRRMIVDLTDRGREAADVINAAVERVDSDLEARVGAERIKSARQVLGALTGLDARDGEPPDGAPAGAAAEPSS